MKNTFSERSQRMQPSAIRRSSKLAAAAGPDLINFGSGLPNAATFPLKKLSEFAAAEICNNSGKNLQYGMTQGHRGLVQWIADYANKKNIQANPENVICTTGSQQALDLIADILIEPGDSVFVETPTYIGALAVFRNSGARLVPILQDSEGIVIEDLREKLRSTPPEKRKLIYLISNFQNPSGISISAKRRKIIADILDEFDVFLVEDDPYGEIYFGDSNQPPDSIKKECPDRVLYLGTFSKLIAPTFRTGWIIAPANVIQRLELAKEAADLCSSMLDQRIVYRFCNSPDFNEHLVHLRSFYSERYTAMETALRQKMPSGISWTRPTGGFFIWVQLPKEQDSELFLEEAISVRKVSYIVGRPFTCDGSGKNCLRLAFSPENPDRIQEGVGRLADLLKSN